MRLCAVDLACCRGGRQVFAHVNFSVASGELLAITGRNGAGKSSLLRTVLGLVRPAQGRVSLEGGEPELTLAEQAHYVAHLDALKTSLTVGENLRFWSGFLGAKVAEVDGALAAVGLDGLADLPAAYLSAGQRRRLSIARLLAVKRPIWLLDEPTSTLDVTAQEGLAAFMQAHRQEGGLILVATHGPLGLAATQELQLDAIESAATPAAPSSLIGEGMETGSREDGQAPVGFAPLSKPTPYACPQAKG
jgi:heme exporter protein A